MVQDMKAHTARVGTACPTIARATTAAWMIEEASFIIASAGLDIEVRDNVDKDIPAIFNALYKFGPPPSISPEVVITSPLSPGFTIHWPTKHFTAGYSRCDESDVFSPWL